MSSRSRGFGLIELMVALALGSLVVLGLTQVFLSARDTYLSQRSSAQMQENARYVLSKLAQEIRMAGMFGCVSTDRVVDAPLQFQTPVSWYGATLYLVSADIGGQAARPDWTVVSDCKTSAKAYPGARLALAPGETGFPVRELFYRFENGQLKVGASKAVLLDNVAAFDVSFGVAGPTGSQPELRYEDRPANVSSIRSVRIGLTLRDPAGRARDQAYQLVVALRNRLV